MARNIKTTCVECRTDWTHLGPRLDEDGQITGRWDVRVTYMPDDPEHMRWLTWSCQDCGWQAKGIVIAEVEKLVAWGVPVDDLTTVELEAPPTGLSPITVLEVAETIYMLSDQLRSPSGRPVIDSVLNHVLDVWTPPRTRVDPPEPA